MAKHLDQYRITAYQEGHILYLHPQKHLHGESGSASSYPAVQYGQSGTHRLPSRGHIQRKKIPTVTKKKFFLYLLSQNPRKRREQMICCKYIQASWFWSFQKFDHEIYHLGLIVQERIKCWIYLKVSVIRMKKVISHQDVPEDESKVFLTEIYQVQKIISKILFQSDFFWPTLVQWKVIRDIYVTGAP